MTEKRTFIGYWLPMALVGGAIGWAYSALFGGIDTLGYWAVAVPLAFLWGWNYSDIHARVVKWLRTVKAQVWNDWKWIRSSVVDITLIRLNVDYMRGEFWSVDFVLLGLGVQVSSISAKVGKV